MKLTLQIRGKEMTFSEKELISILEKHFDEEAAKKAAETDYADTPTEGKWFEVNPLTIDPTLFIEKRVHKKEEDLRHLINKALKELENNPEEYGRVFETMIVKKTWISKTAEEIIRTAEKFGDHNANWVEQALEWAQRICNGETWETLCNKNDTAKCYRLILWNNDTVKMVGGANNGFAPTDFSHFDYSIIMTFNSAVPLAVRYK